MYIVQCIYIHALYEYKYIVYCMCRLNLLKMVITNWSRALRQLGIVAIACIWNGVKCHHSRCAKSSLHLHLLVAETDCVLLYALRRCGHHRRVCLKLLLHWCHRVDGRRRNNQLRTSAGDHRQLGRWLAIRRRSRQLDRILLCSLQHLKTVRVVNQGIQSGLIGHLEHTDLRRGQESLCLWLRGLNVSARPEKRRNIGAASNGHLQAICSLRLCCLLCESTKEWRFVHKYFLVIQFRGQNGPVRSALLGVPLEPMYVICT